MNAQHRILLSATAAFCLLQPVRAEDVTVTLDSNNGSSSFNVLDSSLGPRFKVQSDGKVGIGTGGSPLDKLEVAGDISMNVATNQAQGLYLRKGGAKYWSLFTAPWLNDDDLWLRRESDAGLGYGNINVMAFDRATGYIGIHTTTPEATLHVNGNLKVNGSITYNTPQTGYASVSAAAFHPSASSTGYNNDGTWIYPSVNNAWFYAGVSLPHGATVTSVEWNAVTAGEGDYARLRLVRRTLAGSAAYMAECYSQSGATAVLTDSTISNSTVDNSQYVYYLDMFLTAPSTLAHGGAAIITYTYPGP
ncbi:hypothetical protein PDESU_03210 [Pontiella desulfatans]|uniref:Uncharacterized protein n=1 Tax=Pontiella desulfatans TaxID=2750659 RepID=A0A6C2U428_PONDE|nr:hypothetical protein [Pontiella desulfatans]VGO14645.1 hypothetical protein PDESU_03210 [Pontiella desulfatans]